jgi:periplasmic protein TonB
MKRKNEKVPEFDEIIFENRNKSYGAYDLRKRYKSTASISILSASAIAAVLFTALSFTPENAPVVPEHITGTFDLSKPVDQVVVPPPEIKPPAELIKTVTNLVPKVVTDSAYATPFIPTTDEIYAATKDGKVTDSIAYAEPVATEIPVEEKIFVIVEEKPEFPGGLPALYKIISENIKYPKEAQNNNIQGKVILKFVVNPDGSVDRIEILRSVDPELDNEAIRVVKTLPRFKPGRQAGIPVPVWYLLPVTFKIEINE